MKFKINSKKLFALIDTVNKGIPKKVSDYYSEYLFIETSKGIVKVSKTDSDTLYTLITEDCVVQESGQIVVLSDHLVNFLKNIPNQTITLEVLQDILKVSFEDAEYEFPTFELKEAPKPANLENSETITMSKEIVSKMIAYTLCATSTDKDKPAMNGVYANISPSQSVFVSTDGHRLMRYKRLDVTSSGEPKEFIIPRKALNILKKSLPSDDTPLHLSFNEQHASFSFNNVVMTCRLIDENFPDYENVIPLDNNKTMRIGRKEFIDCLKRISIYANKSTNQIRLKIEGNELLVSAEDIDFANEASEKLFCDYETEDGENIEIGFNAKFLIEGLSNLNSDKIIMYFSEIKSLVSIKPDVYDLDDEDILWGQMPVTLNNYY